MEYAIPLLEFLWCYRPLAVFYWLYHESKNKNETIVEISRNLDDPDKLERLLGILT